MMKNALEHTGVCVLQPLRVIFRQCVFHGPQMNYEHCIHETYQFLRKWSVCMGLNPAELLHVGIPVMENNHLAAYTCCLEYVLPQIDESAGVSLGELPGGRYAVMRVDRSPAAIGKAVPSFNAGYLRHEHLVKDEHRPVYEIYHEYELEYCVPVLG